MTAPVGSVEPRRVGWVAAATATLLLPALILGGPALMIVVVALGLQALVAARRWPGIGRAARTLLVRTGPALLGWLVIVVALDTGVGALWNRVLGGEEGRPRTERLAAADLPPTTDPRVDSLAYRDSPWADRFLAEMEALVYDYVPFIGPRVETVQGLYINSDEGIRSSYEPAGVGGDHAVEVWFFGGSTMWGEGQRDLHTIPSEVARLAEADGITLRAVNFGERGYTAFQEFLLFEQELADRGRPDLAVFYDGLNELGTQQETAANLSEQPTVYQLATTEDGLRRAQALPGAGAPAEPSLRTEYAETSALHKALRRLGFIEPAGAQEVAPLDDVVANASAIYGRSVTLLRDLAGRTGTPVVNFWQPGGRGDLVYAEIAARLPAGVVDITDAFRGVPDDDLLFIDGGHTNETGAHLSAVALWEHLRATVEGLAG